MAEVDPVQESNRTVPLSLSYTQKALASVTHALLYLDGFGDDIAERFNTRLEEAIDSARERIAREIAEEGEPFDGLDEIASLQWSQPVYRLKVQTGKSRARRSSAGLWYVFYSLHDTNGDGVADLIRIHQVRHSAARPLSVEGDVDADGESADD